MWNNVPVLRRARRQLTVVLHFVESFQLEAVQKQLGSFPSVEGHVGIGRPLVSVAEEVPAEAPSWTEGVDDSPPDRREVVRAREGEREAGVDEIRFGPRRGLEAGN